MIGQEWLYWLQKLVFFTQAMLLLGLLYRLGKGHLAQRWLVLTVLFIGTTLFRADQLWAGLLCLGAVFLVWKHLHQVYAGEMRRGFLMGSGVLLGILSGDVFHVGLLLTLGLMLFSVLHCFLHEREEKNISYSQVSNRAVWQRWLRLWGLCWLLPMGLALGASILMGRVDTVETQALARLFGVTLSSPPTINISGFGYFSTFHKEFQDMFLLSRDSSEVLPVLAIESVLMAIQLVLIGFLPVLGIVGLGYQVPNRFVYRLLQRPDEELLLIFISGASLILGTLWHSTSAQIASYGSLAMLMGFMVLVRWLRIRPRLEQVAFLSLWFFSLVFLLCMLWLMVSFWFFLMGLHR